MVQGESLKAQGALEYLIIIAAVLAITGVVTLFLTGTFGGQKKQASISRCKQAATDCKNQKLLTPNATCSGCEEACVDPVSGEEVASNATDFCKQGKPALIGANQTS